MEEVWAAEQRKRKEFLVLDDTVCWTYTLGGEEKTLGKGEMKPLQFIGGVDISFIKGDEVNACACFVVLSFPSLEVVYEKLEMVELKEPYIPGFLAFRECPILETLVTTALQDETCPTPDVIINDGNGLLHTREYGAACHLGILLSIPTIGVGKDYFVVPDIPLTQSTAKIEAKKHNTKQGDWMPLRGDSGKIWGAALRAGTKSINPIFVSIGHMISLETAVKIISLCSKHRIPEPIRMADLKSREYLINNGYNK